MKTIDENIVMTQLRLSEQHWARSGVASYRKPDPATDYVLVGHADGHDHVAFSWPAAPSDWTRKTILIDTATTEIRGAPPGFGAHAYVLRYPSGERERLKRFVLELITNTERERVEQSTNAIIDAWAFLWRSAPRALDSTQQRGLFGELVVLEQFLKKNGTGVVPHWEGPLNALHDFRFPEKNVEVKTCGYNDPVLRISALNQLKPCPPSLVLLMIKVREGGNRGLPSLVHRIREALDSDADAAALFEERLERARYFDQDAEYYSTAYHELSLSSIVIDDKVDVLHEGRLDRPIPGLLKATWSLDPSALAFTCVEEGFWEL